VPSHTLRGTSISKKFGYPEVSRSLQLAASANGRSKVGRQAVNPKLPMRRAFFGIGDNADPN